MTATASMTERDEAAGTTPHCYHYTCVVTVLLCAPGGGTCSIYTKPMPAVTW